VINGRQPEEEHLDEQLLQQVINNEEVQDLALVAAMEVVEEIEPLFPLPNFLGGEEFIQVPLFREILEENDAWMDEYWHDTHGLLEGEQD
jgi:hypothetical protein